MMCDDNNDRDIIRVYFINGIQESYYKVHVADAGAFFTGYDSVSNCFTCIPMRNILKYVNLNRVGKR